MGFARTDVPISCFGGGKNESRRVAAEGGKRERCVGVCACVCVGLSAGVRSAEARDGKATGGVLMLVLVLVLVLALVGR